MSEIEMAFESHILTDDKFGHIEPRQFLEDARVLKRMIRL